jgi:ubiquinone/menaquinone biosynthesis C-methylase UbiE
MEPSEYANIARLETQHWYYTGKRRIVKYWLEKYGPPRADQWLLDCGAGTGIFAEEMTARCQVKVLDDHEEALRLLRERFPADRILSLSGEQIPLPDASVDYVTALDVLEHVPQDAAAVEGFARVLRPGGLAVVTVPASMALWSAWDETLHHFRRYDRAGLTALFEPGAWELLHVNYTNALVFPAVWVVRRWQAMRPPGDGVRAEDAVPASWLNALLRGVFVAQGCSRVSMPFGVSLVLVARRR